MGREDRIPVEAPRLPEGRQLAVAAAALVCVSPLQFEAATFGSAVPPRPCSSQIRGRFSVHAVSTEEAKFKLCRIKSVSMGAKSVPYMVTHDGRTIRYPDPDIAVMDTVKVDIETGKALEFVKFETGNLAMINGGKNTGRVGIIVSREKHQGSFDIVHLKDSNGKEFATRLNNVFVIGSGNRPLISLPKRKGLKKTILEERGERPPKN